MSCCRYRWMALLASVACLMTTRLGDAAPLVVGPEDDLQGAIVSLRGTPRPARMVLQPGRYSLRKTLKLTAEDSGLTIEGPAEGVAEIAGSIVIEGWKPVDGRPGLSVATLPDSLRTRPPRHLFVKGQMASRARTPNSGWFESTGELATTPPFSLTFPPEASLEGWSPDQGLWIIGLQKWAGFKLPVQSIDPVARTVTLNGKLHGHRQEKTNRFWIENAPGALDQPGEWRVDAHAGTIELMTGTDTPPEPGSVTVPLLSLLADFKGCRDVVLRKLTFRECDDDLPPTGEVDSQAAIARRGAVRLSACQNVLLEECHLLGLGGYAIDIGRGSRDCIVRRCELADLGAGGVRIGETAPDSDPVQQVSGHRVEDCSVHDYGRTYFGAVGLIVLQASGNQLLRNDVHHGNYTAVSVGWTWGYRESPCHHNLVENNHLHHIGNDLLSDMGGVYLLGPQPGTIVRRNRIHDIRCHEYGGWALYTDEGSSAMLLEENIVWNCQSAGFHQHFGKDNTIRQNLIVNCGEGGVRRSRDEDHHSFTFEHNVVVCEEPRFLGGQWKQGTTVLRNNLYFSPSTKPAKWMGQSLADWQKTGHDAGSRFSDPLLVDPEHPDLGLRADSPAAAMGIRIPALAGDDRNAERN